MSAPTTAPTRLTPARARAFDTIAPSSSSVRTGDGPVRRVGAGSPLPDATGELLPQLRRHAVALGGDLRLTQGAGGNLSAKDEATVWVKASGTRFCDAGDREIHVALDRDRAEADVLKVQDLSHLVVGSDSSTLLRPSIETALHVLLPQRFVFHVHSVGAIAWSVHRDGRSLLDRLSPLGCLVGRVPYAKPGGALAHEVLRAARDLAVTEADDLVLVLGNHGLLTASPDADRAAQLISDVEGLLRTACDLPLEVDHPERLAGPGAVSPRGAAALLGGVLTPDEAVFLGPTPFGPTLDRSPVAVLMDGSVVARPGLSRDALDIALSFVHVAAHLPEDAVVVHLGGHEVDELMKWEAEKWRVQQSR